MVEQSHNFEFSESAQSEDLVFESFFDFLDGDQVILVIFRLVFRSDNYTVSTRANRVNNFVPLGKFEATT
jgi:hypothetical protein